MPLVFAIGPYEDPPHISHALNGCIPVLRTLLLQAGLKPPKPLVGQILGVVYIQDSSDFKPVILVVSTTSRPLELHPSVETI